MHNLTTVAEQLLKPTATIHVGNKLSLIERKVFNAIIWHSQKSRFAKNDNTLSVSLLMSLIGLERSKNLDVIKEALEKLTTNPIIWNTLKKDRTADWGICTFLAGAELSGGKLRYVLNPLLAEKVNHPTLFAKIQLLVQTQFSSKYSLALYEFLLDELGRAGNPETHEVQATLDTVRHVLQFDGAYKHLNSDVLKPCMREINKHSDISIGYRGVKKGRAVAALLFSIERTAVQLQMPLDDLKILEDGEETVLSPKDSLIAELVERGVGRGKTKQLVDTYDEERIRENIAYVEKEQEAGKVKKLSAYLVRAIEEDYRPKKTRVELRKEAEAAEQRKREEESRAKKEEEKEWNQFRAERVREHFAALPPEEQELRRHAFAEDLRHKDVFLYRHYRKEGLGSRLVESKFFQGVRDELLSTPEETDIAAYLKTQKHRKT
jgi:hypothetical protein